MTFATTTTSTSTSSQEHETALGRLSGIIALAPLLAQTDPASSIVFGAGYLAGRLPLPLPMQVRIDLADISSDPVIQQAIASDPLRPLEGWNASLRGVGDMLGAGSTLLTSGYRSWPEALPLLILHGTADRVTSCHASQTFVDRLRLGVNRNLLTYPDAFHELTTEVRFLRHGSGIVFDVS